jgi:alpha-amylase
MSSRIKARQYINFYFQVHQPKRLRRFQFFDIGSSSIYFDESFNKEIVTRVASNCYLPANEMLLTLIERHPNIRITFSLSGIVIEQLKKYSPRTLESFKQLADTGAVEFLGETYYHSLASVLDEDESIFQAEAHRQALRENFGYDPKIFRNTELIYSNEIGELVSDLGFKGMYIDGLESMLNGRSTNNVYVHTSNDLLLFPRNYRLSDDIAFRYSDKTWSEWPLTSAVFSRWIRGNPQENSFTTLGMDYETFGEHQKKDGGIFIFMEELLTDLAQQRQLTFLNPSEAAKQIEPAGIVSAQDPISWADSERDLSAWLGNDMQKDAFDNLKKLLGQIRMTDNIKLLREHRYLQTSDHFYYMSTKKGSDGNVHQYFSPYNSPYEAFMNYMNVLSDIGFRLRAIQKAKTVPEMAY